MVMSSHDGCPECGSEDIELVNVADLDLDEVEVVIECPDGHTYTQEYEAAS